MGLRAMIRIPKKTLLTAISGNAGGGKREILGEWGKFGNFAVKISKGK